MNAACVVTVLGAIISTIGVAWHQPPLLMLGLLCDVLDGKIARYLDEVTDFGGRLDWYADIMITHALLWSLGCPEWSVVLLAWHAYARGEDIRFSGRAAVSLFATIVWVFGAW